MIYRSIKLYPTEGKEENFVEQLRDLLTSVLHKTSGLAAPVREARIRNRDSFLTNELPTIFGLIARLLPNLPSLQHFVYVKHTFEPVTETDFLADGN